MSDGQETDSDTFTLVVNPINDAPIITEAPSGIVDEDQVLDIVLEGSDIDGDDIIYFLDQDSPDGFVIIEDDIATFIPDENYYGNTSFTYRITDGEYTSFPATVIIIVNPINDAPVAIATSATTIEDQSVLVTLLGSDIDGDNLTFNL